MLNIPTGFSESDILSKVRFEAEYSLSSVQQKREEIKQNYKDYHNKGDVLKIYDHTLKTMTKIYKAVHAKDRLEVAFDIIDAVDESESDLLEALAQQDFVDTKKAKKNKQKIEDMCIAGCGIEIQQWNKNSETNDLINTHPLTWLPDPEYDMNYGYKFHGFELEASKEELAYGGMYNLDRIKSKGDQKIEKVIEEKLGKDNRQTYNSISSTEEIKNLRNNLSYGEKTTYSIHKHYTRFDGVPYLIHTANDFTLLLDIEEITPVTSKQKKNPFKTDYPVTITYLMENRFDVFGDSLFTISGNDQKIKQMFLNLNLEIAKKNAGFGYYAVNKDAVTNLGDLASPNENGPTFIYYENGKGNPFYEVPQTTVKQDSYNMPELMKNKMFYEIGYDESSVGQINQSTTATQQVRAQKNGNLITGYNESFVVEGEEDYYKKWLEQYARNGAKSLKVTMSISGSFKEAKITPGRIRKIIDKIIITSKTKIQANKDEKKQYYAVYGNLLLSQAKTDFSKYMILRAIMECNDVPQDEIERQLDEPIEYVKAKTDVELINAGEKIIIDDVNEDHLAYISVYKSADEGQAKIYAINKRMQAYMMSGQKQAVQQGQPQGGEQQSNIAMNAQVQNMMNQPDAPSLQDNVVQ